MNTFFKTAGTAVALMIVTASSGVAQSSIPTDTTRVQQTLSLDWDAQTFRADAFEAKARSLMVDRTQWHEASDLFRKAAELRTEEDTLRVDALLNAGWLAYYSGQYRRAYRDLERAAVESLEQGNLSVSANAYLDAAWAAAEREDWARVEDFVRRGERLAQAPGLSFADRIRLFDRTGRSTVRLIAAQEDGASAPAGSNR